MGIPSYFSWLVRHFEKRIICGQNPYARVDQLYLDFNCAIHPVARSHPEYTIEQMCKQIVIYLRYLIESVKPTEMVYIAIDGVAPVAKMKQQRLRRYKSVRETKDSNRLKQRYGKPILDNGPDYNMISPATEFMRILTQEINLFLVQYKETVPKIQMIFSDANCPAEGEHKIMHMIRQQTADKMCVIYGLDSDLIMLSMCAKHDRLLLVREDVLLKDNKVDISLDRFPVLNYLVIDELKEILFNLLTSPNRLNFSQPELVDLMNAMTYDKDRVIVDYIVMSFFLGNDFVPSFQTLKIRNKGIEKIVTVYRDLLHKHQGKLYLCQSDMSLNLEFLCRMIEVLSRNEESDFRFIKQMHDRRLKLPRITPTNYEEAVEESQNVESLYRDEINAFAPSWERRYYKHFFDLKTNHQTLFRSQIDDISRQYVRALQWIAQYYAGHCPDWLWYYPYDATPLLTDLLKHLRQQTDIQQVYEETKPLHPYHQLMMILPPQSAHLLPLKYRQYMLSSSSPLIHYYPVDFEFDYYGKRYLYEAHPKIPLIDPHELIYHVTSESV
jgi:5'-3' exonuclease